jgi:hypothetical protein
MGFRRDLRSRGALAQMLVLGCMFMLVGLVVVGGFAGEDSVTRLIGGAVVLLGLALTSLSYLRLRKK